MKYKLGTTQLDYIYIMYNIYNGSKYKPIFTREGYNVYRRVTGKRLSLPLNMKPVSDIFVHF